MVRDVSVAQRGVEACVDVFADVDGLGRLADAPPGDGKQAVKHVRMPVVHAHPAQSRQGVVLELGPGQERGRSRGCTAGHLWLDCDGNSRAVEGLPTHLRGTASVLCPRVTKLPSWLDMNHAREDTLQAHSTHAHAWY